jgi:S1-C subfamily serine protease
MHEDPPSDPSQPSGPGDATQRHTIDPYGAAGGSADRAADASTNTDSPPIQPSPWSRPAPMPDGHAVPASTTGVFGTPHPSSGSDAFGSTAAPAGYVSPTAPVTPVRPGEWSASGPSQAADSGPAVERYTPAPEIRPDWTRTWDETTSGTPERWYEPAPAAAATTAPAKRRRTGGGAGPLIAASLLSAILAAGGTVMALSAAGALDRPAPSAAPAVAQASSAASVTPVPVDEQSATIAVASKVSPAVVKIKVTGAADTGNGVIPQTGVGSGVIFDPNGWILTNHHVVEGGTKFDVELKDGRVLSGTVYGIDSLTDLAIVKVDATGLPTAAIGESDTLKVGQLVVAIGSPLGTYSNSVTSGIVSAKGRSILADGNQSLTNLIQTDAAINPGNSGGPLLDAAGNVVGINTAIASGSNGIGFAIAIDVAKPIMAQAIAGQPLTRPYMGIHFQSITRQLADKAKLPVQIGALVGGSDEQGNPVQGVDPNTPAEKGGIKDGDIIVSVNGKVIDEEHPLDATLAQFSPGETVSVDVLRDGAHVMLQVTLGTRPPSQ